jgi:glucuronate isomerase
MKPFLSDDFLLESEPARRLYHDYAKEMPIFDYHCHLPPEQVARNHRFENLTRIWLWGDHYKWRAMRANGTGEEYITGDKPDREKFRAWAATVPKTIGNPLYHWTHLELKSPFGIRDTLLSPETADTIYDACTEMLQTDEFRARGIMEKFRVRAVCTTDDPADSLEHHKALAGEPVAKVKMLPAFRPDRAMAVDQGTVFTDYMDKLALSADREIRSYNDLLEALDRRHSYFHQAGCRLSDHALRLPEFVPGTGQEAAAVF